MRSFKWILVCAVLACAACDRIGKADVQQEAPAQQKKTATDLILTPAEQAESGIEVESALIEQPAG